MSGHIPSTIFPASLMPFTPVGTIAAVNVQAAIAEVATDAAGALSTALTGYVPYTGATANLALATRNLTTTTGKIGVGVSSPSYGLDIVANNAAMQMRLASNATNATTKDCGYVVRHYTNAEEDVALLLASSGMFANIAYWGGGHAALNAISEHRFYAASGHSTLLGSLILEISTTGIDLQSYDAVTTGYFKGKHKSSDNTAGLASGSFTNGDADTVTVKDGLITSIT